MELFIILFIITIAATAVSNIYLPKFLDRKRKAELEETRKNIERLELELGIIQPAKEIERIYLDDKMVCPECGWGEGALAHPANCPRCEKKQKIIALIPLRQFQGGQPIAPPLIGALTSASVPADKRVPAIPKSHVYGATACL